MVEHFHISLEPRKRGFHIITDDIIKALPALPHSGLLHIHILHTSAGLTISENADPDVRVDFETIFNKLVPEGMPDLVHTIEGPDDMPAHIKASLVGSSVSVPVENGKMVLGVWQGIYLCEFRNRGGGRRLVVSMLT